jgi:hypothetical protein
MRPSGPLPRMTCRACGKDTAASTRIAGQKTERQHQCPHGKVCSGPSVHGCKQCRAVYAPAKGTAPAELPAAAAAPRWRRLTRFGSGVAHTVRRGCPRDALVAVCGQNLKGCVLAPASVKDCLNCADWRESHTAHGETLDAEEGKKPPVPRPPALWLAVSRPKATVTHAFETNESPESMCGQIRNLDTLSPALPADRKCKGCEKALGVAR